MDWSLQARTLLRWWWLIAFLCVAAGATAFIGSEMLPAQYQAEAKVLVGPLTDTNYDQILAYQQLAQTYSEVATTTPVLTRVIARLGLHDNETQLAARLDVRAVTGESIVSVVATAPSALEASQIANAVADEIAAMGRSHVDQASSAPSSATAASSTPSASSDASSAPSSATAASSTPSASSDASSAPSSATAASSTPSASSDASSAPSGATGSSLAMVVQPALPPRSPYSPRAPLNAAIGAALGFALGAGIALFLGNRTRA